MNAMHEQRIGAQRRASVSAQAHGAQRREAHGVRGPEPKSAVDAWGTGMRPSLSIALCDFAVKTPGAKATR